MGSDSAYGEPFYTDKKPTRRTRTCGDCSLWMTQKCPRETVGTDGRKYGPSVNTLACTIFSLDPKVKQREEQELKDVDG